MSLLLKILNCKLAVKVINNKLVIHGNYVNDEFEVEQRHIEMQMLHTNMFMKKKLMVKLQ